MNEIVRDAADGILEEADLWKLFSDHPEESSETVQFYSNLKPLLAKMRLYDETRFFRVYRVHASFAGPSHNSGLRATVAQRNLRRVAAAIAGRGNWDAAIQYLGTLPVERFQP